MFQYMQRLWRLVEVQKGRRVRLKYPTAHAQLPRILGYLRVAVGRVHLLTMFEYNLLYTAWLVPCL